MQNTHPVIFRALYACGVQAMQTFIILLILQPSYLTYRFNNQLRLTKRNFNAKLSTSTFDTMTGTSLLVLQKVQAMQWGRVPVSWCISLVIVRKNTWIACAGVNSFYQFKKPFFMRFRFTFDMIAYSDAAAPSFTENHRFYVHFTFYVWPQSTMTQLLYFFLCLWKHCPNDPLKIWPSLTDLLIDRHQCA